MNIIKIYTLILHRILSVLTKNPPSLITVRWSKDELYRSCVNDEFSYVYLQKICLPILVTCGLDQIHLLVAVEGLK